MSFDGGRPVDPFGGSPFDRPPVTAGDGGWQPPPAGPPPQPSDQTNPLATLSVVFAFVFAPVGALLGHLALVQIKEHPQKGRDRALVGLSVSYVVVVTVVVALVMWGLLPSSSSTTTAQTTTTSAKTPAPDRSLAPLLLDGDELESLLGQPFETTPKMSADGGRSSMPDATNPQADAKPAECVGAVSIADQNSYRSADVRDFASESWFAPITGVNTKVVAVDEAVVALSDADAADAVLSSMAETWKKCEGTTVEYALTTPAGHLTMTITDVRTTGDVLSATLQSRESNSTVSSPESRAVMVKDNLVVETHISFFWIGHDERQGNAEPETAGIEVAEAIADKIAKAG